MSRGWVVLAVAVLGLTERRGEGKTIDLYDVILRVPPSGAHASQTEDLFGYSGALHHTVQSRVVDPVAPVTDDLSARLDGAR